jgi:hypothetical protein
LVEGVATAAKRVGFYNEFLVSYCGGMFNGELMLEFFRQALGERTPSAMLSKPKFGPAVGALLIAYKQANFPHIRSLIDAVNVSQAK